MGFGYSSYEFELIDEEQLAKICPETYNALNELRTIIDDSDNHSFEDFVKLVAWSWELDDEESLINDEEPLVFFEKLHSAYKALQDDVKEKVGLDIVIGIHNSDDGSRYDDVDGIYFEALNIMCLTPAGALSRELGLSGPAQYVNAG